MFSEGDPRCHRAGRPKGSKNERTQVVELLGEKKLRSKFLERFEDGDDWTCNFAFEHWLGRPITKTENKNAHEFPQNIEIILKKQG
jgi:hypothetical protein